jgi:hypothetical protein
MHFLKRSREPSKVLHALKNMRKRVSKGPRFRVQGSGFRVQEFRVQKDEPEGLGFRV